VWLRRIGVLAVCMALITPLFVTTIPPLLDYPKHLMHLAVLATGSRDLDLAQLYAMDWHGGPNLGMDMVVPLLVQIIPLTVAGKIFLALALILPLLGTVALHDAIFEKRSWWPLASAILVYNAALLAGFLDFAVGMGLALLGTASWVRLRHHMRRQVLTGATLGAALFFVHAFAGAFLLVMITAFELCEAKRPRSKEGTSRRTAKLALGALPAGLLYVHTWIAVDAAGSPLGFRQSLSSASSFDAFHKAAGAFTSFFTYDTGSDLLILIAVAAALGALSLGCKLAFAWPALVALAIIVAYPFVPGGSDEKGWFDTYLPVLAGFLFFAGITPRRLGRRETAVLGFAFAALIMARLGVITLAWQGQNADVADINAALAPVKAQDRLLVLTAPQTTAGSPSELYSVRSRTPHLEPATAQLN
jgi:hypothetical protein